MLLRRRLGASSARAVACPVERTCPMTLLASPQQLRGYHHYERRHSDHHRHQRGGGGGRGGRGGVRGRSGRGGGREGASSGLSSDLPPVQAFDDPRLFTSANASSSSVGGGGGAATVPNALRAFIDSAGGNAAPHHGSAGAAKGVVGMTTRGSRQGIVTIDATSSSHAGGSSSPATRSIPTSSSSSSHNTSSRGDLYAADRQRLLELQRRRNQAMQLKIKRMDGDDDDGMSIAEGSMVGDDGARQSSSLPSSSSSSLLVTVANGIMNQNIEVLDQFFNMQYHQTRERRAAMAAAAAVRRRGRGAANHHGGDDSNDGDMGDGDDAENVRLFPLEALGSSLGLVERLGNSIIAATATKTAMAREGGGKSASAAGGDIGDYDDYGDGASGGAAADYSALHEHFVAAEGHGDGDGGAALHDNSGGATPLLNLASGEAASATSTTSSSPSSSSAPPPPTLVPVEDVGHCAQLIVAYCSALAVQAYFESSSATAPQPSSSSLSVSPTLSASPFVAQLEHLRRTAGGAAASAYESDETGSGGSFSGSLVVVEGEDGGAVRLDGEELLWRGICEVIRHGEAPPLSHHHQKGRGGSSVVAAAALPHHQLRSAFASDWEVGARMILHTVEIILGAFATRRGRYGAAAAAAAGGPPPSSPPSSASSSPFALSSYESHLTNTAMDGGAFSDALACIDGFGQYMEHTYRRAIGGGGGGGGSAAVDGDGAMGAPASPLAAFTTVDRRLLLAGYPADTFVGSKLVPVYGSFVNVMLNIVLERVTAMGTTTTTAMSSTETEGSVVGSGVGGGGGTAAPQPPPSLSTGVALRLAQTVLKAFHELTHTMHRDVSAVEHMVTSEEERVLHRLEGLSGGGGDRSSRHNGDDDGGALPPASAIYDAAMGDEADERLLAEGMGAHGSLGLHRSQGTSASRLEIAGDEAATGMRQSVDHRVRFKEKGHVLSYVLPFGTPQLSTRGADGVFTLVGQHFKRGGKRWGAGAAGGVDGASSSSSSSSVSPLSSVEELKTAKLMHRLISTTMQSSKLLTGIYKQPPTAIVKKKRKSTRTIRGEGGGRRKVSYVTFSRAPVNYSMTYLAALRMKKSRRGKAPPPSEAQRRAKALGIDGEGLLADVESTASRLLSSDKPVFGVVGGGDESANSLVDPALVARVGGVAGVGAGGIPLQEAMRIVDGVRDAVRIQLYIPPTPQTLKAIVKAIPFIFKGDVGQGDAAREKFMGLGATGGVRRLDPRTRRLLPTPFSSSSSPSPSSSSSPYPPAFVQRDALSVFDALQRGVSAQYVSPVKGVGLSANAAAAAALGVSPRHHGGGAGVGMGGGRASGGSNNTSSSSSEAYDPALELPIIDEKGASGFVVEADSLQSVDTELLARYAAAGNRTMQPVIVGEWAMRMKMYEE